MTEVIRVIKVTPVDGTLQLHMVIWAKLYAKCKSDRFFSKSLVNIFLEYLWLKILFLLIGVLITSFCISSKLVCHE